MQKGTFEYSTPRSARGDAVSFSRQSGFTIVEVMMSLVLLAIGAALSLPSYREMVEKRQLTHGAEQIMAFVNSAQGEAMKQNQVVTVSYERDADDDWCLGAVIGNTACDCMEAVPSESDFCTFDPDASPRPSWRITNENVGNTQLVKSMDGAEGAYSFDPVRGILLNLDDSLLIEMRSESEDYRLNLMVSNTGEVILCSKDSSHSVPGYAVCEGA